MALSPPQAPYKRAAGEENFGHRHSFFTILHDFSLSRAALYTPPRCTKFEPHPLLLLLLLLLLLCCCCCCAAAVLLLSLPQRG